jgi:hypothetical protein
VYAAWGRTANGEGEGEVRLTQGLYGACGGTDGSWEEDCRSVVPGVCGGVNCEVMTSSAPSRASLKMRPMAFNGFESESPVRWRSRRASMLGKESGVAGSSPAWSDWRRDRAGDGIGIGLAGGRWTVGIFELTGGEDEPEEDDEDGKGGECEREDGSVWMAASTFLPNLL